MDFPVLYTVQAQALKKFNKFRKNNLYPPFTPFRFCGKLIEIIIDHLGEQHETAATEKPGLELPAPILPAALLRGAASDDHCRL